MRSEPVSRALKPVIPQRAKQPIIAPALGLLACSWRASNHALRFGPGRPAARLPALALIFILCESILLGRWRVNTLDDILLLIKG